MYTKIFPSQPQKYSLHNVPVNGCFEARRRWCKGWLASNGGAAGAGKFPNPEDSPPKRIAILETHRLLTVAVAELHVGSKDGACGGPGFS